MAAVREIAVKMTLDGGQTIAEAEKVDKSFQEIENSTKSINEQLVDIEDNLGDLSKEAAKGEAAKQFEKLNKVVEKNLLSIRDLGVAADNFKNIALAAGTTSPVGQQALKRAAEMEKEMDKLNQSVANLAEGGRGLNTTLQLGTGVVAGYTAFQGITEAAGLDNENLQKALVKVQSAQAALLGLQELKVVFDKKGLVVTTAQAVATNALAAAQRIYGLVVGTSTGMMKGFRVALASTGIGAIVVGIGLLIANFDKVSAFVKDSIEKFGGLKNVLLALLGPIGWIILAYQALFGEVDDGIERQRELQKKANIEAEAAHKENIKNLEEERELQEKVIEEIIKKGKIQKELDSLAILQAQARGASETEIFNLQKEQNEIKLQMAKDELAAKQEIIRINHEIAEAEFNRLKLFLETQATMNGWTEKQVAIDLQRLEDAKARFLEEEQAAIDSGQRTVDTLEAQNQIFLNKRNDKLKAANDKRNADQAKADALLLKQMEKDSERRHKNADELIKRRIDANKRLEILLRDQNADDFQLRMNQLNDQHLVEMGLLSDNIAEESALKLELERQFQEQLQIIKDEAAAADAEVQEQERQANFEKIEGHIEKGQQALEALNAINDLLNVISDNRIAKNDKERDEELGKQDARLKKELSKQGLSEVQKAKIEKKFALSKFNTEKAVAEANDKIAKRAFIRNKALQIAQATIDTGAAVVKALASAPPPVNFLLAASVGIAGAAQIAKIASTKFEGTAGSISPPDISIPSAGSEGESSADGEGASGASNDDVTTDTAGLLNNTVQVSIVEIQKVGAVVDEIDNISTL